MKRIVTCLLMLCATACHAADYKRTFPYGGKQRSYELHVPKGARGKLPCVLVMHGGGSNSGEVKNQSQMVPCADANGFAVCFPNGTAAVGTAYTWNTGGCCGYALNHDADDVGFISTVITDVVARYNVDPKRVYLTGMSNGAQMAWHAGCALAGQQVAAFCAVSSCCSVPETPRAPIAAMQISGLLDTNAPFNGGVGGTSVNKFDNLSTPEQVLRLATLDGCDVDKPITATGSNYVQTVYLPKTNGGPSVVLYALPGGGHTWPGGVDITKGMGTGPLVKDFNANQVMWDFFKQHRLP